MLSVSTFFTFMETKAIRPVFMHTELHFLLLKNSFYYLSVYVEDGMYAGA